MQMKQAINHSKDGGTPENDQKNRPRDSEEPTPWFRGTDSDLHMGISPSPNDNFANIKDKQNDIQNELNEKIHDEKRK